MIYCTKIIICYCLKGLKIPEIDSVDAVNFESRDDVRILSSNGIHCILLCKLCYVHTYNLHQSTHLIIPMFHYGHNYMSLSIILF